MVPRYATFISRFFCILLLMTPSNTVPDADNPDADRMGLEPDRLLITDFTPDSEDLGWFIVNDNVMGGRSEGSFKNGQWRAVLFRADQNTGVGDSVRFAATGLILTFQGMTVSRLRVLGDGRRYTWRLTTDARFHGREVAWWADFGSVAGSWLEVDVPFSEFIPRFRGSILDGPALDPGKITGMGLMIYDKRDGAFELRLASVHAYIDDSH